MWKLLGVGTLLMTVLVIVAGVARSDDGDSDGLTMDSSFPLPPPAQDPVSPAPPRTPPVKQPFAPYDNGGPAAVWEVEDLTAEEREIIELGRDVSGWAASQDVMMQAVKAQAEVQAANIAQRELGLGELGEIGVVP